MQFAAAVIILATAIVAAIIAAPAPKTEKDFLGNFGVTDQAIHNQIMMPAKNCKTIKDEAAGTTKSGLYRLSKHGGEFTAFCDMELQQGGWTVIMRRKGAELSFNRNWNDYVNGFGNVLNGNFFLGLENIHSLTMSVNSPKFELWIGLQSHEFVYPPNDPTKIGEVYKFAHYKNFRVGSKDSNYQLTLSDYDKASTAGDSFSSHNGAFFSTPDRDNDMKNSESCAKRYKSGWWFRECHDVNLSGVWRVPGHNNPSDGIVWETFHGDHYSLKSVVMAVRPLME